MKDYSTRVYRFVGSHKLADEVAYLIIKNDCRVSQRTSSGIFKKEHFFEVFGKDGYLDRFEAQLDNAKRNIR